jgi:hypothetical protein
MTFKSHWGHKSILTKISPTSLLKVDVGTQIKRVGINDN